MAFTPISTTLGPWTVSQLQVLTPTTTCPNSTKEIVVGNYNYGLDFTLASSEPNRAVYNSITGAGQESPASVRISLRNVNNVYSSAITKPAKLANSIAGTQINMLVEQNFSVSNSISGEFGELPFKFSITLTVPKHPSVTAELIKKSSVQTLGAIFGSDEMLGNLIASIFRGDLRIDA